MVQYKQKSLILNIIANKAINANKKQDNAANKKLNAVANKTVNTNKD